MPTGRMLEVGCMVTGRRSRGISLSQLYRFGRFRTNRRVRFMVLRGSSRFAQPAREWQQQPQTPELVAMPARSGVSAMDTVGVLRKAVQEQDRTIVDLRSE